jgi:hypothetical protein
LENITKINLTTHTSEIYAKSNALNIIVINCKPYSVEKLIGEGIIGVKKFSDGVFVSVQENEKVNTFYR